MKVRTDTIVRTVVLILALVNQILTSTGHSPLPVDDHQATELITLLLTIGASVWAWWKNNSFTQKALLADEILRGDDK